MTALLCLVEEEKKRGKGGKEEQCFGSSGGIGRDGHEGPGRAV